MTIKDKYPIKPVIFCKTAEGCYFSHFLFKAHGHVLDFNLKKSVLTLSLSLYWSLDGNAQYWLTDIHCFLQGCKCTSLYEKELPSSVPLSLSFSPLDFSWVGAWVHEENPFGTKLGIYSKLYLNLQHNDKMPLCWMSLCWVSQLFIVMLNVIMLSVIMLRVVAPPAQFLLKFFWNLWYWNKFIKKRKIMSRYFFI
jgi:hypothetical protein